MRVKGQFAHLAHAMEAARQLTSQGNPAWVEAVRHDVQRRRIANGLGSGAVAGLVVGVGLAWLHIMGILSLPQPLGLFALPRFGAITELRLGGVFLWASLGAIVGAVAGGFGGMAPHRDDDKPVAEVVTEAEDGLAERLVDALHRAGAHHVDLERG